MTAKRDLRVYLVDILGAIEKIRKYTLEGQEKFMADDLTQDGVIRQLSIVGEAVSKIPMPIRSQHPEIPWKQIVGMRNIIVHDYSQIKLQRVWVTIENDLPSLRSTIEGIYEKLDQ